MTRKVAFLSIHSSPLANPGTGDAGGMNVYVDSLARTLARRSVEVDVFTGRRDPGEPGEIEVIPDYRVLAVGAEGDDLADQVAAFAEGIAKRAVLEDAAYDVIHSHYWLSGWAGLLLEDALRAPLAISFHTLGRVKEAARAPGEPRESLVRIAAESEVVSSASCVVASTPSEAAALLEHYQASPERLCVFPPGVDHERFRPGDRAEAAATLGLADLPTVAVAGRIQPLKGLESAIAAIAAIPGARLLVAGGPSGPQGDAELARLRSMAEKAAPGRVAFLGPVDHRDMPYVYRAADALLVPSRSESFGLAAVEAQACGTPVVAARVGGLVYAVADDASGYLVPGHDPGAYAEALRRVLFEDDTRLRLGRGAVAHAARFSWDLTADRLLELYGGIA